MDILLLVSNHLNILISNIIVMNDKFGAAKMSENSLRVHCNVNKAPITAL